MELPSLTTEPADDDEVMLSRSAATDPTQKDVRVRVALFARKFKIPHGSALPASPAADSVFALTVQSGSDVPGIYIALVAGTWTLIASAGGGSGGSGSSYGVELNHVQLAGRLHLRRGQPS